MASTRFTLRITGVLVILLAHTAPVAAQIVKKCPRDSAKAGNACVDKYEASVWLIADPMGTGKSAVKKINKGTVTLADLNAAGAQQLGCTFAPYNHMAYPGSFPGSGNWTPIFGSVPPTPGVYAVSIAGVLPSGCTTGFQAAEACALSGKHLPTNDEWQIAAAGTPYASDDGVATCHVDFTPNNTVNTGSRASCKSNWGTFDQSGNVGEWTGTWNDRPFQYTTWLNSISFFGGDGASAAYRVPGAVIRGGHYQQNAGIFYVSAFGVPSLGAPSDVSGFRCAR